MSNVIKRLPDWVELLALLPISPFSGIWDQQSDLKDTLQLLVFVLLFVQLLSRLVKFLTMSNAFDTQRM